MNHISMTLDIDWAPDCAIDYVANQLLARRIKATWFVTHRSAAVERLERHPELFELGIHPNFLPGSTHGDDPDQVLRHCCEELVPAAVSMRSHALVQSTPILQRALDITEIRTDVSLFLPGVPQLQPFYYRAQPMRMTRLPYCWEDDVEMIETAPDWTASRFESSSGGLRILDFHPIHIYLNSPDLQRYQQLKELVKISDCTAGEAESFIYQGVGTRSLFLSLINSRALSSQWHTIREIDDEWRSKGELPAIESAESRGR